MKHHILSNEQILQLCCFIFIPLILIASDLTNPGQYHYNVLDSGARGDGKHLDTKAIQKAIDNCAETGGTVFLPPGSYLSGTLFIKNNVTLHISQGALLLASTNLEDYPRINPKFRSYNDLFQTQSLIYGENLKNIAIVGKGTIDGQGDAFKVTTKKRPDRYMNRPFIFCFVSCKNVNVEGINLRNSARWMQHYLACEDVTIHGIKVYNHCNQNNDMIDIDGCRNVIISDCIGDTDDDALTIKSTSARLSENIAVTNCVLSSHCNAIKLGTESHGGFRNIAISNCVIKPSQKESTIFGFSEGIAGIVLAVVDGGLLDGVQISNVRIDGAKTPIFMRLGNRGRTYMEGMEKPPIGTFRNVKISHVIATQADTFGCSITGLPGHVVEHITLDNIRIRFKGGGKIADAEKTVAEKPEHYPESTMFGKLPAYGFYIRHANNITLNNIDLSFEKPDHRPAVICDDVSHLNISGMRAWGTDLGKALLQFNDTRNAMISDTHLPKKVQLFLNVAGSASKQIGLIGNDLRNATKIYEIAADVDEGVIQLSGNLHNY
jgi:polygalacturonase